LYCIYIMWKCNRSDYKHTLYNLNRARSKSGDKQKNLIEHILLLQRKEAAEGKTRWLVMAWTKALAKMKRYGVTDAMVQTVQSKKGLNLATK